MNIVDCMFFLKINYNSITKNFYNFPKWRHKKRQKEFYMLASSKKHMDSIQENDNCLFPIAMAAVILTTGSILGDDLPKKETEIHFLKWNICATDTERISFGLLKWFPIALYSH